MKRWILLLLFGQVVIILVPLTTALVTLGPILVSVINVSPLLIAAAQCYLVLFEPRAFDNIPAYEHSYDKNLPLLSHPAEQEQPTNAQEPEPEQPSIPANFTDEMLDDIGRQVEDFMKSHQPYLQPRYKLSDLSDDKGIGVHKLSAYINRRRGTNLYGYLNQLRIEYCISKIKQGEQRFKTLEALSAESGFQSRTTFIREFKGITGVNPSEYLENLDA